MRSPYTLAQMVILCGVNIHVLKTEVSECDLRQEGRKFSTREGMATLPDKCNFSRLDFVSNHVWTAGVSQDLDYRSISSIQALYLPPLHMRSRCISSVCLLHKGNSEYLSRE